MELANRVYVVYLRRERREQRRLPDAILSSSTLHRGTPCPTYKKPFDLIVEGAKTTEKLGRPDYLRTFGPVLEYLKAAPE